MNPYSMQTTMLIPDVTVYQHSTDDKAVNFSRPKIGKSAWELRQKSQNSRLQYCGTGGDS